MLSTQSRKNRIARRYVWLRKQGISFTPRGVAPSSEGQVPPRKKKHRSLFFHNIFFSLIGLLLLLAKVQTDATKLNHKAEYLTYNLMVPQLGLTKLQAQRVYDVNLLFFKSVRKGLFSQARIDSGWYNQKIDNRNRLLLSILDSSQYKNHIIVANEQIKSTETHFE